MLWPISHQDGEILLAFCFERSCLRVALVLFYEDLSRIVIPYDMADSVKFRLLKIS